MIVMDTRKYIIKRYQCAHPCMALVVDVLENEFHIKGIPTVSPTMSIRQRSAVALELLSHRCTEVRREEVQAGDVVLIDRLAAHVGIMINKQSLMHYPNDNIGVIIENLDSPWLSQRIVGFYRP